MWPGRCRPAVRAGGALAAVAIGGALAGCGSAISVTPLCTSPQTASAPDQFNRTVSVVTLPYGLQYGDISIGCGQKAQVGDQVTVEYTGWLTDGSVWDSSRSPGRQPFAFPLGEGQVIKGFDVGVMGMRVGGQRRLIVPPLLGYGNQGVPPVVPPNATLIIDVQVLGASH